MIFANFGSGGYEFIDHAIWNGLHVADLVFPCFVWIMGVCIPISLTSSFKKDVSNKIIIKNVLKRSVKLFCLGIFLGSGSDLNYLRIFGVLQRFGVAYLVVTTIWGYMGPGGLHKNQAFSKCVGGATSYIDGLILGNHRYQNPTIYEVYESKPFDPEGVLGK
ncbi:hypothetical protein NQ314_018366 [Rhamnusium bicolor]|uniref:DUF5009 domain-containing protein n=1 Tax=Rhamnusium bicolor TaxID=1586634 RepID=A0AAV8WS60_9CUCU|nr:hypothetical protein NQ314_018366 [Rhamnusium bicolor]